MPTLTVQRFTWDLIGSNRFVDTKPCNSILLTDNNIHIKRPWSMVEGLQSQSQRPATSSHLSVSHSLLRNNRAQSQSPCSESEVQGCPLQSTPFCCWSGYPPELPVICKARIDGTPKPPWWTALWRYDQRLRSITWQYAKHNTLHGYIPRHAEVYQASESQQGVYIGCTTARNGALNLTCYYGSSWGYRWWTHISDVSMYMKLELVRRGSTEWLGMGKAMPWEVLRRAGWCLTWQLQWLFKIKLLNEDGAFVEYWWSLALTTIPEHSRNFDPISKFVPVRIAPAAVALEVFSMGNIVGCVHVIPEIATSSMTGDGRKEQCIVNSHIDLATWNDVYNW